MYLPFSSVQPFLPKKPGQPRPTTPTYNTGLLGLGCPPCSSGLGGVAASPSSSSILGLGKSQATISTIPDGVKGTAATIAEMKRLAHEASVDPKFIMWCRSIVADLKPKAYYDEAQRIYDVVKQHVRYVLDPRNIEYVQDPRWVLFVDGQGDCDDASVVVCAIAMALGHDAAFKTVAVDPTRPDEFSHVYPLIGIQKGYNTEWWAADTTQKQGYLGWEPPDHMIKSEKIWYL